MDFIFSSFYCFYYNLNDIHLNFNSIKNDNKKVMHMKILWSTYYLNVLWDEIKILIKHF